MAIVVKRMTPLLQVFDMPAAIAFYRDALGFEVVSSNVPGDDCDWVMLKLNDVYLMLNTAYEKEFRPAAPDPKRIAAHIDTTVYFGCEDVQSAYEHMVAAGLQVKPPSVTGYGYKAVYVKDPDGFTLCFQWPEQ